MAKYSPKTRSELSKLVDDESVNLGDIDTSAITDMSGIFCDCEREDFSGIEKWDTSNVENGAGSMFVSLYYPEASMICEQLKKAYLVNVDVDNQIDEVYNEEYATRLDITYIFKRQILHYGKSGSANYEHSRAIGYQTEMSDDDWNDLVVDENLTFEDVDILLQNGLGVAAILRLDEYGLIDKVLGVYPSRIEALNANMDAVIPLEVRESGDTFTGKMLCLGYQPPIEAETFIGKTTHYMQSVLHGVNWARNLIWWLVEADSNDKIINIVETFYSPEPEPEYGHYFEMKDKGNGKYELAEIKADDSGEVTNIVAEYSTDKKPNPNNRFVLIDSNRIWEDRGWYYDDEEDEWDDEDYDEEDED